VKMKFTHPELFREVTAIGGHYSFVKEATVSFKGRKILYYVGLGTVDTSCCGIGGCIYAYVPGYLVDNETDCSENGGRISEIAPVEIEVRSDVADVLKLLENVTQVIFMTDKGSSETLF
jgi:hypothetical protein